MATFQVPQFIDQKPKIIGPLTLGQFFYLAGAGGISFAAFYVFNFTLWLMVTIIVGGVAITLAFIKINGRPLISVLQSAFAYFWQPRVYTWQRKTSQKTIDLSELEKIEEIRKHMSIQEKLKSIVLGIATRKIFSGLRPQEEKEEKYQVVTYLTGERKVAKKVDY